ncbi:hypothetical protein D3C71_1336910 [compost metagenome]
MHQSPIVGILDQFECMVDAVQYAVVQPAAEHNNRHHQRKRGPGQLEDQPDQIGRDAHGKRMGSEDSAVEDDIMQHAETDAEHQGRMPVMIDGYE